MRKADVLGAARSRTGRCIYHRWSMVSAKVDRSPRVRAEIKTAFLVGCATFAFGGVVALVPAGRTALVALVVAIVALFLLVPKGWFATADRTIQRLILTFLALRLSMPFFLELVAGEADAFSYHVFGEEVAADLRTVGHSQSHRAAPGTGTIDLAVGNLYALGAPARIAVYSLWNTIAVIGMLLFWWATKHLVGRHLHRYTAFVFLTPTLLLWNSTLGKDALLAFGIGSVVAGIHVLSSRIGTASGLTYIGLGAATAALVRPHVGLLLLASATAGIALAQTRSPTSKKRSRRLVPLVVAAAAAIALVPITQDLINPAGDSSLLDAAYESAEQTARVGGESSFEVTPTRSVTQVPGAVVTVLLRPFPWESRSILQVLTSLEALLIGGMLARSLWAVARLRAQLPRSALVVMSIVFTLLFCVAFASLGNFGLLARQRAQVYPFILLLIFAAIDPRRSAEASAHAGSQPIVATGTAGGR